jgi:hypothetical protein
LWPLNEGGGDEGPGPIWCRDDALAEEPVKALGRDWHFASSGEWYRWNGKCWKVAKLRYVWHLAQLTCRRVAAQLTKADELARQISSSSTINAIVRLASAAPGVVIDVEAFDRNIRLLNT